MLWILLVTAMHKLFYLIVARMFLRALGPLFGSHAFLILEAFLTPKCLVGTSMSVLRTPRICWRRFHAPQLYVFRLSKGFQSRIHVHEGNGMFPLALPGNLLSCFYPAHTWLPWRPWSHLLLPLDVHLSCIYHDHLRTSWTHMASIVKFKLMLRPLT